jgi:hypothetical protein
MNQSTHEPNEPIINVKKVARGVPLPLTNGPVLSDDLIETFYKNLVTVFP